MKWVRDNPRKTGGLAIAIAAIAGFEGLRTRPYTDAGYEIMTVCYGHTGGVQDRDHSRAECEALLQADALRAMEAVNRHVKTPISHETRAALTSFVFNVGEGAFARSTLLRKLNAGDRRGACDELPRWVYANGKKLPGLVKRREKEREICLSGL